ncbi:MAG TPA: hypothetical protein VMO00_09825, partial [Methylomirabilota bacterium]|nr:hypothetical protein [Methylomirabilota bacterium]
SQFEKVHWCHAERAAKHLGLSVTCEDEILRLRLRMTVATLSLAGGDDRDGGTILTLFSRQVAR